MSDPWKGLRDAFESPIEYWYEWEPVKVEAHALFGLLADADVLLTIKLVCDEVMDRAPLEDAEGVPDWLDTLLGKLSLTMSALPKHLRRSE